MGAPVDYFFSPLCRLCPESIPWLVANRRATHAEKILKKAAKMNKLDLPPVILKAAKSEMTGRRNSDDGVEEKFDCKQFCDCKECIHEYGSLFTHRILRKNTLILFSLW